jgi:asparagine synthase (glutamine-hydrolysing)
MCGIYGGINIPVSFNRTALANGVLHRGPDAHSYYEFRELFIGHTLLKIRDKSIQSNQPFEVLNRYVIAFNGEIYSIDDATLNIELKSSSKSELHVITEAFSRFGLRAIKHFSGMFAMVVLDKTAETITLVRDGSGQKPLYFYKSDMSQLAWSSELKAIAKLPKGKLSLNHLYIRNYFEFGFPIDDKSLVQQIWQVPPGYAISFNFEGELIKKEEIKSTSMIPVKSSLKTVLDEVLESHFLSDSPMALSLSGGLDSAIIAGFAHSRDVELDIFSTYFTNCVENNNWDFYRAQKLSMFFDYNFHAVEVSPSSYIAHLEKAHSYLDEPLYNQSLPAYLQLIRQVKTDLPDTRVLFTGAGGDELFGGYPHDLKYYQQLLIRSILGEKVFKLAYKLKSQHEPNMSPYQFWHQKRHLRMTQELFGYRINQGSEDYGRNCLGNSSFKNNKEAINVLLDLDYNWLIGDNLQYLDRFGLRNNIECRSPLASHHLRMWCRSFFSPHQLFGFKGGKRPLLQYSKPLLPKWYLDDLEKHGWAAPLAHWYELNPEFREFFITFFESLSKDWSDEIIDFSALLEILKNKASYPGKWLISLYSLCISIRKIGVSI